MNPTAKRADQLQFLRFLAFCLIFIHHTDTPVGFLTSNGSGLAVSFFFILSGFVSAYSHYGKAEKLHWYSPFRFLGRKYLKVLPLHLLTLGISILLSNIPAAFAAKDPVWLEPQLLSLGANVLLIHSWSQNYYFDFNGVSWFLSSIMFSYLFTLPVSDLFNKHNEKKHSITYFLIPVILLPLCSIGWSWFTRDMDMTFLQYIAPPARLLEYLAGMALCHLVLNLKERIPQKKAVTILFTVLEVLALGLWISYLFLPHKIAWMYFTARWILPNVILLFVFGMGSGWISTALSRKPLKRLGDVSFECFLIHQLVIRIYLLFNSQITPGPREQGFRIISCFVITVGLALLLNKPAKPTRKKIA